MSTRKVTHLTNYAAEMLFHAAVAAPWEVSEEEFLTLVAMMSDGTTISHDERQDIVSFFAVACDYASRMDVRAADAVSIYRAAVKAAKSMGCKVHGEFNLSPEV